ncbi:carbon-nitrogen hydrolase family protein [uncultured Anaerovibrio sp.]|uniref:carbon-nitrogen hydrolase family protein n=1 Tax=uncultured Anaerovibrio sp. TaxID=361586 RepID=UPI00260F71EA|nr:carbon-nitrogen hydrolase family protein [uncultured Anaerovibrio sp.]
MKILQAQMIVSPVIENAFQSVEAACQKAVEEGADFLTLPEMFCCPYETANFPRYAEAEGGNVWNKCAVLAEKYNIYISAGSVPELGEAGEVYNTAYVFDRQGRQIAKHRKMHLFDIDVKGGQSFKESDTLTAGRKVTVFDTEFGSMGLCICYDFRFPELARLMVLKGAKVIFVPAAFNMTTGPAHWELMFRSQAMFNQCFAIGTSPARDLNSSYHSWGHSIAVDPWGNVIAQMDEKEGYQLIELDLSKINSIRQQLPLIKHRRTDLYTLEVK